MGRNAYFDGFMAQRFVPDPTSAFTSEFDRLATHMQWTKGSKAYTKQRAQAVAEELNSQYGHTSKLEGWQELCSDVGISPVPPSIRQCKKSLAMIHVNIFDVVDYRSRGRLGMMPQVFKSAKALKAYSWNNQRIFPLKEAKEDGSYLRALLRRLV